jgi:glycerol kinase
MESIEMDTNTHITCIKVDGGMSNSNEFLQIQSNISQTPLVKSDMVENTAWGCAVAAGLAIGLWNDVSSIIKHDTPVSFSPSWKPEYAQGKKKEWDVALKKSFDSIFTL